VFSNEFKINKVEKCAYVKNTYKDLCYCMLILDNNDHVIKSTKKMLNNKFDIKDLSVVDVTLIIKNYYDI